MRRCIAALSLAAVAAAGCGSAAGFTVDPSVEAGMHSRVFEQPDAAGERQFWLYTPEEYLEDPEEPWPLVLFLHGFIDGPTDLPWVLWQGLPKMVRFEPYRFLMVAPYVPTPEFTGSQWPWVHSVDELRALVDHVGSLVDVDPDRIYVAGGSWGATGAWAFALAHPEVTAAVITVAGGWNTGCPLCAWPDRDADRVPGDVCSLSDIPTWILHGTADRDVPVESSRAMVEALTACGADVRSTFVEGVGHELMGFDEPGVIEWMLAQGHDGDWPAVSGG